MKKFILLFSLLVAGVFAFSQSIFLDPGKSITTESPKGLPVLSYSMGAGGSSQGITLTLEISAASPELFNAVVSGTVFKKMELDIYNDKGKIDHKMIFSDVIITSYQTGLNLTETITLSYSKLKTQ